MELTTGQALFSCDGVYDLVMQGDGNLVLYKGASALWSSNTAGTAGSIAVLQDDGNFVVYTSASVALWSSATGGSGCGVTLALQTDGNLVLYSSGTAIWDTGT
jgi:hypothetical protein